MATYTPDQFAAYLMDAATRSPRETEQVVRQGAENVKADARKNVRQTAPVHNAGAHRFINFDVEANGTIVEAEIGYDRVRGGKLGNLLEYGGGGDKSPPHRDLGRALDVEEAKFPDALGDMGARLLGE